MARCSGCSGDRCSCKIVAGSNMLVSGAGTTANPYVLEAGGGGGGGEGGRLIGEIVAYGGATAPGGWLLCNGSTVSRVTYAGLFAVIGTTYGSGDGANTFHLPDLAGRFPMGSDGNYPRGSEGGSTSTTLTLGHLPTHTHTMAHTHTFSHDHGTVSAAATTHDHDAFDTAPGGTHTHLVYSDTGGEVAGIFRMGATIGGWPPTTGSHQHTVDIPTGGSHSHSVTIPATGALATSASSAPNTGATGDASPTAVSTLPPYTAVNYLIKT